MQRSRLLIALIPWLGAVADALAQDAYAIIDVSVLPMTSEVVLHGQTVVIQNERIAAVSDDPAADLADDVRTVDGRGLFLMPGLMDLHIHLLDESELVGYLNWGVTTVMHLGGSGRAGTEILRMRDAIRQGSQVGPTVYTTNQVLDGVPRLNSRSLEIADPESARQAVRELKADGFDFVKIYNNIDQPEFLAIVDEARQQKLAVIGHVPRKFPALQAISGGQNAIAHTEELFFTFFEGPRRTDETMQRRYEPDLSRLPELIGVLKDHQVAVMPDLSFTFTDLLMWDDLELVWNDPEFAYLHPEVAAMWRRSNINRRSDLPNFMLREHEKYKLIMLLTQRFEDAGILQVVGTDSSIPGLFPGKAVHRELTELIKAGLTPYQALAVGTRNGGEFLRRYIDEALLVGEIREGWHADFVLLRANPLDDIRNARLVEGVAVSGRYIPRQELDALREAQAQRFSELREAMSDRE